MKYKRKKVFRFDFIFVIRIKMVNILFIFKRVKPSGIVVKNIFRLWIYHQKNNIWLWKYFQSYNIYIYSIGIHDLNNRMMVSMGRKFMCCFLNDSIVSNYCYNLSIIHNLIAFLLFNIYLIIILLYICFIYICINFVDINLYI